MEQFTSQDLNSSALPAPLRPGEGRHVGGFLGPWKEHTVTEREAVEIMRTFTPHEVADAITSQILEQPVQIPYTFNDPMHAAHKSSYSLEDYVKSRQEEAGLQKTPYEMRDQITAGRPDLYNLYHIVTYITSRLADAVVATYPERFAALIGQESLDPKDQTGIASALGRNENFTALRLGIPASFYPQDKRPSLAGFKAGMRPNEYAQIREFTPDIVTTNESADDRFNALTTMLSMTHNDALEIVCKEARISEAELAELRQTDRVRFAAIQRRAGLYLARNSLVGVLHDYAREGHGAVYNHHSENGPAVTERGVCAGYALNDALVQGLGLALKQNSELILNLVANPLMQMNEQQRQFFHDADLLINAVQKNRGGYLRPEMAKPMRDRIVMEASRQIADRSTAPHLKQILQSLIAEVKSLQIRQANEG